MKRRAIVWALLTSSNSMRGALLLTALAIALIATPWAMRIVQPHTPVFSRSMVRNPNFVKPYRKPKQQEGLLVSWEPTGRFEYSSGAWGHGPRRGITNSYPGEFSRLEERPLSIQKRVYLEEWKPAITLPDGRCLEFLGAAISYEHGETLLLGPDLNPLSDSERSALDARLTSDGLTLAPPRHYANHSAAIRLWLQRTPELWREQSYTCIRLRDRETGWPMYEGRRFLHSRHGVVHLKGKTENAILKVDCHLVAPPSGPSLLWVSLEGADVAIASNRLDRLLGYTQTYEDLADVPLPSRVLREEGELEDLLSATLQADVSSPMGFLKALPAEEWPDEVLTNPVDTTGMTAGDLFNLWRARYPEHAVVWVRGANYLLPWVSLAAPGLIWERHPTRYSNFLSFLMSPWKITRILLIGYALLWLWSLLQAMRLRDHLRRCGYTRIGLTQAEWLYLLLGRRAWRIPAYDELGAVPDVNPDDAKSIARVMREAEEP
ncbi:hypothetical protein KQI84_04785 [bacterium]|nr:hypothetical protein [bacterium]